jgi:two-component system chemotaxis response regulator CheB
VPKTTDDTRLTIQDGIRRQERGERAGESSVYTCPDCGGVLWQIDEGRDLTFSCHIGHAWEAGALVAAKTQVLQQAAVEAARVLKEKSMLVRQLALKLNPQDPNAALLVEQADQDEEHARVLQAYLGERTPESMDMTDQLIADVVRDMRQRADD